VVRSSRRSRYDSSRRPSRRPARSPLGHLGRHRDGFAIAIGPPPPFWSPGGGRRQAVALELDLRSRARSARACAPSAYTALEETYGRRLAHLRRRARARQLGPARHGGTRPRKSAGGSTSTSLRRSSSAQLVLVAAFAVIETAPDAAAQFFRQPALSLLANNRGRLHVPSDVRVDLLSRAFFQTLHTGTTNNAAPVGLAPAPGREGPIFHIAAAPALPPLPSPIVAAGPAPDGGWVLARPARGFALIAAVSTTERCRLAQQRRLSCFPPASACARLILRPGSRTSCSAPCVRRPDHEGRRPVANTGASSGRRRVRRRPSAEPIFFLAGRAATNCLIVSSCVTTPVRSGCRPLAPARWRRPHPSRQRARAGARFGGALRVARVAARMRHASRSGTYAARISDYVSPRAR